MEDEYDVNGYTDEQLFQILDLNNPSDRELEAKTLNMVRKYANFGNSSGDKLSQFFIDIYNRFFENDEMDPDIEPETDTIVEGLTTNIGNTRSYGPEISVGPGFQTYQVNGLTIEDNKNSSIYSSGIIGNALPQNVPTNNIFNLSPDLLKSNVGGVIGEANVGNKVTLSDDNLKLTKNLDYAKDKLNPLLKQTIKRIISIDSQYRNKLTSSPSTNFTFNLSEPLRDVVSLSLYSIQIPYTWYTVNSDFGGNFFYLKGNAPGIMNGFHDYKISITSGNYTPSGLATALNKSIDELKSTVTDVSFGQTRVIYNDGIKEESSGTGKCKLFIDITKIYNQSNYSLQFPNWSSPIDDDSRITTVAGYLGFNNQEYYCSSIYSNPTFSTGFINAPFDVKESMKYFKIVPYIGTDFLNADISYTPIEITLPELKTITISDAVNLMNDALKQNDKIDPEFSGCTLVNITNPLQANKGNSYVKLNCKLKNSTSPVIRNLNLAALFPNDDNSLFYGSASIFAFSDLVTYNNNQYVVCEFNELLAETRILQSSYDSSNTSVEFKCNLTGYDNSYNNLTASLSNGVNPLNSFIKSINTAIKSSADSKTNPNFSTGTETLYSDSNNFLVFKPTINNVYKTNDYAIYATYNKGCNLPNIFDISVNQTQISTTSTYATFNNRNYSFNSLSFDASDEIYIVPTANGNKNSAQFVIKFYKQGAYSNGSELADYFMQTISQFKDSLTGTYPFAGTQVSYSITTGFTLNLHIETGLNQSHYNLNLRSSNNVWWKLAFYDVSSSTQFDFSYNIKDYSNNDYKIQSKEQIKGNEIIIYPNLNDTFYLQPSQAVDIFNKSSDKYKITIKIDASNNGTSYFINELLTKINLELNKNEISVGTTFSLVDFNDGRTFVKCKFNINTVFTTKDYNLVFYDPYSFTSCFSNNSKNKVPTSIQNATWDTTLGWLLGYRNAISYDLSEYVNVLSPTTDSIYYLNESKNICVLTGDTNVSTNLYNYFLIMLDDYVQNHLNDGLVTITNQETSVNHGPYVNVCDPVTGQTISRPADYGNPGVSYTAQQLYAFNQQVQSQLVKAKSYSKGPFVKDVFGIIPVKTPGNLGSVYVEFGGSLQNQQRLYFGPVNIHRMTIQLLNDRGNLVDLNNSDWSFSFICEQLYKNGVS